MIGTESYLLLMLFAAVVAGLLGSLCGFGGGVLLTPILTLVFGVPVNFAIGASVVSVIGTSCGSASAFLKEQVADLKVGTLLNTFTASGAVVGALTTVYLVEDGLDWMLYLLFGTVLVASALDVFRRGRHAVAVKASGTKIEKPSGPLGCTGQYYDEALREQIVYRASRPGLGSSLGFLAGVVSGLLGIGGGTLNVLVMNIGMKMPFKVSTATSNFMIGVTAAAGAAIFYLKGYINALIVGPVAVGVVLGSMLGARLLIKSRPASLRLLFTVVLLVAGVEMLQKGVVMI